MSSYTASSLWRILFFSICNSTINLKIRSEAASCVTFPKYSIHGSSCLCFLRSLFFRMSCCNLDHLQRWVMVLQSFSNPCVIALSFIFQGLITCGFSNSEQPFSFAKNYFERKLVYCAVVGALDWQTCKTSTGFKRKFGRTEGACDYSSSVVWPARCRKLCIGCR